MVCKDAKADVVPLAAVARASQTRKVLRTARGSSVAPPAPWRCSKCGADRLAHRQARRSRSGSATRREVRPGPAD